METTEERRARLTHEFAIRLATAASERGSKVTRSSAAARKAELEALHAAKYGK